MAKKKTSRKRRKSSRMPKDVMEEMNREIDRRIERWARKLLIVDGGRVRRLTDDEVQRAVSAGRPRPRVDVAEGRASQRQRLRSRK